jgi:hypothetical protein
MVQTYQVQVPKNNTMQEVLCEQLLAAHLVKKFPEVLLIQNISPMVSILNPALRPYLLQVNVDTILIFRSYLHAVPNISYFSGRHILSIIVIYLSE